MEGLTFNEENHEYKLNGLIIPSVTQIISGAGLVNFDYIDEETLREKAELGKKVHTTTELYDKDSLDIKSLHPILRNYLNSWINFKKDYGFLPLEIEETFYHKDYNVIGCVDRIGFIGKDKSIVDLKHGIKLKSHAIQTAGYKLIHNYKKSKGNMAKKRFCVYLTEKGYKVEENKEQTDEAVFLAALTIYNYKRSK